MPEHSNEQLNAMENCLNGFGYFVYDLSNTSSFALADPAGGQDSYYIESPSRKQVILESFNHLLTDGVLPMMYLLALWDLLSDIPLSMYSDEIDEPFLHFPKRTERFHIWHWFETHNGFMVGNFV